MKTELYTDDCFKVLAYLKYGEHDLETVISPLQAGFTCIALQAAIVHNSLRSFSPKNAQRGSWFFFRQLLSILLFKSNNYFAAVRPRGFV